MSGYKLQEESSSLAEVAGCLLSIFKWVGILCMLGGLIISITGVGAVAGIPIATIGFIIYRIGFSFFRDPVEFLKGLVGFIVVIAAIAGIVYSIFEYPEYTKVGAVAVASLFIVGLVVTRMGFFWGQGLSGFFKGLLGVVIIIASVAGILYAVFELPEKLRTNNLGSKADQFSTPISYKGKSDTWLGWDDESEQSSISRPETWKKYTNSRFGFAVFYPPQWEAKETSQNGDGASIIVDNNKISVYASFTDIEFERKMMDNYKSKGAIIKEITTTEGLKGTLINYLENEKNIYCFTVTDSNISYSIHCTCNDSFKTKYPNIIEYMAKRMLIQLPGIDKRQLTSSIENSSKADAKENTSLVAYVGKSWSIKYPIELAKSKVNVFGPEYEFYNDNTNLIVLTEDPGSSPLTYDQYVDLFVKRFRNGTYKSSDLNTVQGLTGRLIQANLDSNYLIGFVIVHNNKAYTLSCDITGEFKAKYEADLIKMASSLEFVE